MDGHEVMPTIPAQPPERTGLVSFGFQKQQTHADIYPGRAFWCKLLVEAGNIDWMWLLLARCRHHRMELAADAVEHLRVNPKSTENICIRLFDKADQAGDESSWLSESSAAMWCSEKGNSTG